MYVGVYVCLCMYLSLCVYLFLWLSVSLIEEATPFWIAVDHIEIFGRRNSELILANAIQYN
jgi:hypothetical protein